MCLGRVGDMVIIFLIPDFYGLLWQKKLKKIPREEQQRFESLASPQSSCFRFLDVTLYCICSVNVQAAAVSEVAAMLFILNKFSDDK